MSVYLFEDEGWRRLLPLTWTRPACELLCGTSTLRAKAQAAFGQRVGVLCRGPVGAALAAREPGLQVNELPDSGTVLLLNGRGLWTREQAAALPVDGPEETFFCGDVLVAARVAASRGKAFLHGRPDVPLLAALPRRELGVRLVSWPWDLYRVAGELTAEEFARFGPGGEGRVDEGAVLLDASAVHVASGARVMPLSVIDAEGGPVIIDADALVMPHAYIQGPAYIGPRSVVKVGAKIYEGTCLGPFCKVGGEVEETVIQGYSNKQHDGFLGHACLGEWVNIGADTNASDLKNNYSSVKVWVDGELVDTGQIFVGLFVGDHTKTGINVMLNTGTVLGVGCNVFGSGLPPKYVPSFCWGGAGDGAGGWQEHRLDRFLATARVVASRRGVVLSTADEALLRSVFEETAPERERFLSGRLP